MNVLVLFYSTYGHIYEMALAIAEGAQQVEGAHVEIKKVPETLPEEVLTAMGAQEAQKAFEHIDVATIDDLRKADAIIFGTPTRFGMMAAQMKQFLDATGELWIKGELVGKLGGVFTSSATQHGGQETTIRSFHTLMLHQGMLIAGLPYAFQKQMGVEEVKGGSPYGASTIADGDGSRLPSDSELDGARYQGKFIAEMAKKLTA